MMLQAPNPVPRDPKVDIFKYFVYSISWLNMNTYKESHAAPLTPGIRRSDGKARTKRYCMAGGLF